jgi:hypothetical protein
VEIEIGWKNEQGEWMVFPMDSILDRSRTHAIYLFSHKTPVIVKQDSKRYVTNSESIRDSYRRSGKNVVMFPEIEHDSRPLRESGFF